MSRGPKIQDARLYVRLSAELKARLEAEAQARETTVNAMVRAVCEEELALRSHEPARVWPSE